MRKKLAIGAALLALVGVGGTLAYWRATWVERTCREVREHRAPMGLYPLSTLQSLAAHHDDPRVQAAFAEVLAAALRVTYDAHEWVDLAVDVLEKHPPAPTDRYLDLVVRARASRYKSPERLLACVRDDALVAAALDRGAARLAHDVGDFEWVASELEKRRSPVSDGMLQAAVKYWVEDDSKIARAWIDGRGDDPAVGLAFVQQFRRLDAHLMGVRKNDPDNDEGVTRLMTELERRHPPFADRDLDALVRVHARGFTRARAVARSLDIETQARLRERAGLDFQMAMGEAGPEAIPALLEQVAEEAQHEQAVRTESDRALDATLSAAARSVPRSSRREATIRALISMRGPRPVQYLSAALTHRNREVVNVAARALATIAPGALADPAEAALENYSDSYAAALRTDRQPPPAVLERGVLPAEALFAFADTLLASAETPADRSEMYIIRALSCPDPSFASHAARVFDARLVDDRFADALFRFIARKHKFRGEEMTIYDDALQKRGPTISAGIVRNLERLLADAGGDPSRVYWVAKRLAFTALKKLGSPAAVPVLEKYVSDPGDFTLREFVTTAAGEETTKSERILFARLCTEAIDAIRKRNP